MNGSWKKVLSIFTVAALVFQAGIPSVFAEAGTVAEAEAVIEMDLVSETEDANKSEIMPEAEAAAETETVFKAEIANETEIASETEAAGKTEGMPEEAPANEMEEEVSVEMGFMAASSEAVYIAGVIAGEEVSYTLDDFVNNEVIILYADGNLELKTYNTQEELAQALEELKADESVDMFQPNIRYEGENGSAQAAVAAGQAEAASGELAGQNVETAEQSGETVSEQPDDEYFLHQWGLNNNGTFQGSEEKLSALEGADINPYPAWESYEAKRNAVVAIIDTGIDYGNSEISDAVWINEDEIAQNGIDDDDNGYIDDVYGWNFYRNNNKIYYGAEDSHGTHCAGTIGAVRGNSKGTAGIADYDNIKIMSLKALGGRDGTGTTMSVMLAINYAEKNGADICNLSLGTTDHDMLLYRVMANSDMLFVVAAGNSSDGSGTGVNTDIRPCYPASYPLENIISVANLTAAGELHSSSDYGVRSVDIAAPGTDILGIGTDGEYVFMTGTSMAAPMVTAAAALVYTCSDSITLGETRNVILNTAAKMDSLAGKLSTGGMLDLGAAVTSAAAGGMTGNLTEDTADGSSGRTDAGQELNPVPGTDTGADMDTGADTGGDSLADAIGSNPDGMRDEYSGRPGYGNGDRIHMDYRNGENGFEQIVIWQPGGRFDSPQHEWSNIPYNFDNRIWLDMTDLLNSFFEEFYLWSFGQ